MTPLENNIAAVTKAARTIEKKMCSEELQPRAIVESCKAMTDYINAANLLSQIKAVVQPNVIEQPKKNGLFKI